MVTRKYFSIIYLLNFSVVFQTPHKLKKPTLNWMFLLPKAKPDPFNLILIHCGTFAGILSGELSSSIHIFTTFLYGGELKVIPGKTRHNSTIQELEID